ncbi:TPA: phage holin, partial [Bacillus cereus]|nr:phage holin [Bacillus cereus]HDR4799736.1 phage holin [Bacillus cereus]HDR4805753.1 phage holin [Bacillus cereus]HDR4811722.1 phage holin [Bacillus cereus]HDR4834172.1 phage holin [Bacillus cereus]
MKNLDAASISRYVILVIAVINSVLNLVGYQTIDDKITNDLVAVITG